MLTDWWEAKLMAAATYISSNSQQESEGESFQKCLPVAFRAKESPNPLLCDLQTETIHQFGQRNFLPEVSQISWQVSIDKIAVRHSQAYIIYISKLSEDQGTNPASELTGAGCCGLSCERRRRASSGANENDSFMPPSSWQRGRLMSRFSPATSVSIRHLLLNWFARENMSLSSITGDFTTTKLIR